jgi:formate dehydrogenase major subunit
VTRLRIRYAKQTTTICPYCGCGCGLIVSARGGKIVNIEGDPDHPVNQGSLCAKGGALYQVANNPRRLRTVRYRAPGSDHWEEVSWNWAINRISRLVKETRDKGLAETAKKSPGINRTDTIAALGGAALDNEECYLYSKLMRALGVVYIEHQARI